MFETSYWSSRQSFLQFEERKDLTRKKQQPETGVTEGGITCVLLASEDDSWRLRKSLCRLRRVVIMFSRILIVEDNPMMREALLRQVSRLDVHRYAVKTGEESVELAEYFDLIMMDVNLPGISGVEATRQIRQREKERGLEPVVIVATTTDDNRFECLSAGMNDFYKKPLSQHDLSELVAKWIAGRPQKLRFLG